jgi:phosphoribosyl 1,2-cyclic phosphate phosphodiesterase
MRVEARILGCGSSGGVPRIGPEGPDWGACDPHEPRNVRTRCSLLVRAGGVTVLIDTSPDMARQLIEARAGRLDAVLYTHDHADQAHGIDDLRMVAINSRARVPVYADSQTLDSLSGRFGYCFKTPAGSAYPPILEARTIPEPPAEFSIPGRAGALLPVTAFAQEHGGIRSLGFRIKGLAYSSDVVGLDEDAFAALAGVDVWIVDALRYKPHPSHAHVEKALAWIARVRPRRAILTNLHVDLDYRSLAAELPPGVEPAYDGMEICTGEGG